VEVDVDDITIVLALLNLLTHDLPADNPMVGVADRVSERLRTDIATLGAARPAPAMRSVRRPPLR
jgi:hypothetical protein